MNKLTFNELFDKDYECDIEDFVLRLMESSDYLKFINIYSLPEEDCFIFEYKVDLICYTYIEFNIQKLLDFFLIEFIDESKRDDLSVCLKYFPQFLTMFFDQYINEKIKMGDLF